MNIRNHYPQFLYYNLVMNRHLFKDQTFVLGRSLNFWAKADAKVLLFFELTKYFCKKNARKMHFLCNRLKISKIHFAFFGPKRG